MINVDADVDMSRGITNGSPDCVYPAFNVRVGANCLFRFRFRFRFRNEFQVVTGELAHIHSTIRCWDVRRRRMCRIYIYRVPDSRTFTDQG